MQITPSPLERWFTDHPGPYRHFFGGASAAAWPFEDLLATLNIDPLRDLSWDYATPEGDAELREAIAREEGLDDVRHVLLTLGASEANFLTLVSLIEPGDEVVIQVPSYPQFTCLASALGARIIPWEPPADFLEAADSSSLERLLTPQTRLVILNSPHNPTGWHMTATELTSLVVALRRLPQAYLLLDEVYRHVGPAAVDSVPALRLLGPSRVLVSQSVSKSWALPGARLGWLAGDPDVIQRAITWREHQGLALAAPATRWVKHLWPHRARIVTNNQSLLESNRRLVQESLAHFPQLHWHTTRATAIGLLGPPPDLRPGFNDEAFAHASYTRHCLFVVPGSRIGYPGRLRIGYGHRNADELSLSLSELLDQLSSWLHSLEKTERHVRGAS